MLTLDGNPQEPVVKVAKEHADRRGSDTAEKLDVGTFLACHAGRAIVDIRALDGSHVMILLTQSQILRMSSNLGRQCWHSVSSPGRIWFAGHAFG